MEINIKRGYEILPDNNIVFCIRITNNTSLVISDVQVILDYNASLFRLVEDRVRRLDSIPPATALTAKFTMKPTGHVLKEKIEASIIYRDPKWEKHMVAMQPKEIQQSNTNAVWDSGMSQGSNNSRAAKKKEASTVANKQNPQDEDVVRMYDAYLKDIKSKSVDVEKREDLILPNNSQRTGNEDRKIRNRGMTPPSRKRTKKKKHEINKKKLLLSSLLAVVILSSALYYAMNDPYIMESIGFIIPTDIENTESMTIDFLNAVNNSDYDTAFSMCQGKNFLAVASVEMLFTNKEIEEGSIGEIFTSPKEYAEGIITVYVECSVTISEPYGERVEVMPMFFLWQDLGQGWAITQIVIPEPGENVDLQAI